MRRVLILALGLAALPARADLPKGEWPIARPIILPALRAPGLVYLPLDEQALAIRSLSEYRVVRGARVEVPYRMEVEQGQTETQTVPAKVVSQGTLAKEQAQVTLDLGSGAPSSNRLRLRLRGDNFRSRVRVEGSRDQREWWLLADKGLVFRHEARFEQTEVATPPQEYRFLRVTVSKLQGALPGVEGVSVLSSFTALRRLVAVPATLSRREAAKRQQTVLDLDPHRLTRDLAEAKFEVAQATFDREVTIEAAARARQFEYAGSGSLRRLVAGRAVILPLEIASARRVRMLIANGDDPPLTIRRVALFRLRRGLIFFADPAQTYQLWYGRRDASEAVYDIQRLPMTTPPAKLPLASLGPERKLPLKPPPPPPWSEQHPALFWGALAAVLVALGVLIVRAMRGVKPGPNPP